MAENRDKIVTVETEQTDSEILIAGLAVAGGTDGEIPPITAGRLPLLEAIESPLLSGGQMSALDCVRALYVLHMGARCLRPIYAMMAMRAEIERVPEKNADYFAALSLLAERQAAFDVAALQFCERMGVVDGDEFKERLQKALSIQFDGFRILPSKCDTEPSQKKSTPLMGNGLRAFMQVAWKCVRAWISMRTSGASRLLK